MAQFKQWFYQDLSENIVIRHCESVMFTGDDKGALVGVRLFDNGAAYSGGGAVTGAVKRSDGGRVVLTGTLSGNAASVVIPAAALAYAGPIGVQIILTDGSQKTTVLKAVYGVDDTSGVAVDPGELVPDIDELLAEIETMRQATAAANAAAASANNVDIDMSSGQDTITVTITRRNGTVKTQTIESVSPDDVSALQRLFVFGKQNLFDPADVTEGYYVAPTGGRNANTSWGYAVVNVEPSTSYSITGSRSIIAYYSNGSPTGSGDADTNPSKIITTPANVTMMTVSVLLENLQNVAVVKSSTVVPIEETYADPSDELNVYNKQNVDTKIAKAIKTGGSIIHPATYQANLPDANNAQINTVYRFIGFASGTSNIPANLPFTAWPYNDDDEAFLFDFADTASMLYREQLFIGEGGVYSRAYYLGRSTWSAWDLLITSEKVVEVDVNHPALKDYASLTQAIIDNTQQKNVKIIVHPGTYDMISELEAIYGSGYLETISSQWFGCTYLGNGVHVVFAEGAVVTCNYQGSNTYVRSYFSPFNAAAGGFTLENLNISCSGVRYCVHDERSSATDVYQNYYLNCQMYKDSENGAIQQQCIGGGLGVNGQIIIRDCYFSGDRTNDSQVLVSYHNSSSGSAHNKVVVTGCYFDQKGRLRFAHYGNSPKMSMCLASGNSFGAPIEIAYETPSSTVENMRVIAWNNEVRA